IAGNGERELIEMMGLNYDDFRPLEYGFRKWRKGLRLGSIQVYYDCSNEPSARVILSGQACREFEMLSSVGWIELFRRVLTTNFSFSRLDLAIDDFGHIDKRHRDRGLKPYFKVAKLIKLIEKGLCRSKFEKGREQGTLDLNSGDYEGQTVNFGSGKSRIQIRIYEKHWERKNKGYELEEDVEVWNRVEVQMRKERAEEACMLIASGKMCVGEITAGVIKNYLNFCDRGEDSNKSRWKVSKFWSDFLGDVEPLRLSAVAPDRTLSRTQQWAWKQVEPSLALLWHGNEGRLDWLIEMLENGSDRLKPKDLEMLERTKGDYQFMLARRKQLQQEEVQNKALKVLHQKSYLDEEGQAVQDTIMADVRYEFEEFNRDYSGSDYYRDLAKMRQERYQDRKQNKNALADGTDEGHTIN
ncbi:replication initiation factor domain-containing protein, partial [Brevibacillus sp. SYSU BS000544]|uniref:replication initiation factor domain-containing protein n=1 Tax=Brevibacillus sp. SYSU BS000544 TaxID=3416443 RepID=UPI003CE44CC9